MLEALEDAGEERLSFDVVNGLSGYSGAENSCRFRAKCRTAQA